jgi:hypothetical protein
MQGRVFLYRADPEGFFKVITPETLNPDDDRRDR